MLPFAPLMDPAQQMMTEPPLLLGRVAAGDTVAIRECLARYGGLVWSIARRFEGADAEDAVQEIFLDLWKSAARFDRQIATEAAFVAMIARRRLIDRKRTRGRRPTIDPMQELPAVASDGSGPDTCAEANQAARALDQLRPEQRQVLVLATCHGLSHNEIAAQTGMPLGTVKAHARRGLMSIRAALLGVQSEENS
jgi:RNA polymerase sigma-70 factor (ECF subfamily)